MRSSEIKSLASLETFSKPSLSNSHFAWRMLFMVSASLSPKNGDRPLRLESRGQLFRHSGLFPYTCIVTYCHFWIICVLSWYLKWVCSKGNFSHCSCIHRISNVVLVYKRKKISCKGRGVHLVSTWSCHGHTFLYLKVNVCVCGVRALTAYT